MKRTFLTLRRYGATFFTCSLLTLTICSSYAFGIVKSNRIAFTSDRDGNPEIYVMNDDGSGQKRLTFNTVSDDFPAFSPDGRRIAFTSHRLDGNYFVRVMNDDGTGDRDVTQIRSLETPFRTDYLFTLAWSPDGRRIAFQDGGEIFTVEPDGSGRSALPNDPVNDIQPAYSPDGKMLAFAGKRSPAALFELHTMSADGVAVKPVFEPHDHMRFHSPDWSPDGRSIAFVDRTDTGVSRIMTTDLSVLNKLDVVTNTGGLYDHGPKWSPDGDKIMFHRDLGTDDAEIFAKSLKGGDVKQLTNTSGSNYNASYQRKASPNLTSDYDGDGTSDLAVFRPADGTWYLEQSSAGPAQRTFGAAVDRLVPADYDGDLMTDIGVYRDGEWWLLSSADFTVRVFVFGGGKDLPVPADYSGDGQAELAVFRNGEWWVYDIAKDSTSVTFFGSEFDRPIPADYDGDHRADHAVLRNVDDPGGTQDRYSEIHINRSNRGYEVHRFGLPGDIPVSGDYDGDGSVDVGLFRDGVWYILGTSVGEYAFPLGQAADIPVPGDYDGDGYADAAIFREGTWHIQQSRDGLTVRKFGLIGDLPSGAGLQ